MTRTPAPNINKPSKPKSEYSRSARKTRSQARLVTSGPSQALRADARLATAFRGFIDWNPFPNTTVRRHKYCETVTFSTGTAGVMASTNAWSLNSAYDPNVTGTGHQPYGFDQMAALYSSYRVINVSFECVFTTPGSTADLLCACVVYGQNGGGPTLTGLSTDRVSELPNVSVQLLSPYGNRRAIIRGTFSIHQVLGITKNQYLADPNTKALVSASPAVQAFVQNSVGSPSGVSGEACTCITTLVYDIQWFDRAAQSQS